MSWPSREKVQCSCATSPFSGGNDPVRRNTDAGITNFAANRTQRRGIISKNQSTRSPRRRVLIEPGVKGVRYRLQLMADELLA